MSTQNGGGGRKVTVGELRDMKTRGERIAVLTAYDYLFARLVDEAGTDIILVGDSLAQVLLGLDTTLSIGLDDMIYHATAVCRGVSRSLVVVDLPFLTYQVSAKQAVSNAGKVLKKTGANAVKLEGGSVEIVETIGRIVRAGIPVMGHLGYTPQSINALGGHRIQGRGDEGRERMIDEARRLEAAGVFAIVLELIPGDLAKEISSAISVPTIGIGAGAGCDGQVLVLHDMLGLNTTFSPRFLRRFANLAEDASRAVQDYVRAVKEGEYPAPEHTFA